MSEETEGLHATTIEELQPADFEEARALVDRCMRPGEGLSMASDFPLLVGPDAPSRRLVARVDGRLAAHVAARRLRVGTPAGRSFDLLDIGAVSTDPDFRGRGLARRLLEVVLEEATLAGIEAAVLWSEVDGFYEKLGFVEAGLETRFTVERPCLPRTASFETRSLGLGDLPALTAMRNREAFPLRRNLDEMHALFRIPRCRARVALEGGRPVAYAVLGKGLDFQATISEWGGIAELVPTLMGELMDEEGLQVGMILGPAWDRRYRRAFESCGCVAETCDMAMFRLLNPLRLRAVLEPHFERPLPIREDELIRVVFGRAGETSPDEILPFYIWGLDSV